MSGHVFRGIWPVLDSRRSLPDLMAEAKADLDRVLTTARARLVGPCEWELRRSVDVAGSGRTTELVLVCTAPAVPRPRKELRLR